MGIRAFAALAALAARTVGFRLGILDRAALLDRVRSDQAIVQACVEAMQRVQGEPPVPNPAPDDLVTRLGSEVIKQIGARYSGHPNYDVQWQPEHHPRLDM